MAPVQALRERLGLSQVEFARLIGATERSVRGWEAGERAPQGSSLAVLAGIQSALDDARTRDLGDRMVDALQRAATGGGLAHLIYRMLLLYTERS